MLVKIKVISLSFRCDIIDHATCMLLKIPAAPNVKHLPNSQLLSCCAVIAVHCHTVNLENRLCIPVCFISFFHSFYF